MLTVVVSLQVQVRLTQGLGCLEAVRSYSTDPAQRLNCAGALVTSMSITLNVLNGGIADLQFSTSSSEPQGRELGGADGTTQPQWNAVGPGPILKPQTVK